MRQAGEEARDGADGVGHTRGLPALGPLSGSVGGGSVDVVT